MKKATRSRKDSGRSKATRNRKGPGAGRVIRNRKDSGMNKVAKWVPVLLALALCLAFLLEWAAESPQANVNNATLNAAGANATPNSTTGGTPPANQSGTNTGGIANPASVYCVSNGGKDIIMTNPDGSQYGVCVFPNGSQCEEWAYMRGNCSPAAANASGNATPPVYLNGSACGSILSRSGTYALSADMDCPGTALTIAADNITIDCAGHSINGSGANPDAECFYGVSDPAGSYRPVVENCIISGFCAGISFYSTRNGTIANDSLSSDLYGIYLMSSSEDNISSDIITSDQFDGLFLASSSDNLIYNNLFNNSVNLQTDGSQNFWNTTLSCGGPTNIVGGSCMGGNFWAQPSGNGWSQNSSECNPGPDAICTSGYTMGGNDSAPPRAR